MSGPFEAKFDGWCSRGKHRIHQGDTVQYVDDELIHTDCVHVEESDSLEPSRTEPYCGQCFTYHAGECS